MAGLFQKLLGKKTSSPNTAVPARTATSRRSGRREPPTELDWTQSAYIPLPPSPPTWEVGGRSIDERDLADPVLGPVFDAAQIMDHRTVVALATGLTSVQRQGRVAGIIAKSYRKIIIAREKAGELHTAANKSLEMFEMVAHEVQDVDKRRFNRIIAKLDKAKRQHSFTKLIVPKASSVPQFSISESSGWALEDERKLEGTEQPDPRFNVVAVDGRGTWLLHRVKTTAAAPDATAALKRIDRFGCLVADEQLGHDAYRVGVGSSGPSLAIMDSSGVLHVYDENIDEIVNTDLRQDPHVVDHFATIETDYWGEFKTQVRAVDVSPDGGTYLFTFADEAWCISTDGRTVWGVSMPLREGWARAVGRSDRYGVGADVNRALALFGLSLPVDPHDIKTRWRALAFEHHPDMNPDVPQATDKMREINKAFEVLTGVDPETLDPNDDKSHFVRTKPDRVIEADGIRIEITMGGVPQDWIYAASFAASEGRTFVATYSGKVVLLSRDGAPLAVYDLGTCPTEIIDQGQYTYFLTPTRLYVVEEGIRLAAFLDVFEQGRLIVSQTGFGLLDSKRFQWFTRDGTRVGEVTSLDPIRLVAATDGGAVIKTRRREVTVNGLVLSVRDSAGRVKRAAGTPEECSYD